MSKNIVLDIENVSKQYRLGEVGTGTLQHDIKRWWASIQGKEDPYLKIGETNDRTAKGDSDYVWALKDINFQVEQGQAVGIIGRNGAGKSTLLKLLSRVTKPTTGTMKYKGRIASLLEVGTGFHPEMTGRENIYLNGAILGMTRKEITRKFDEIVDFAGVERYIDTPVKRYSSGMYVRLAFAVAAHLESEILIVDEVLAVGDADFQKKCLGKMGDVTKNEGRTILFVSHNMAAIQNLCDYGILLENGNIRISDRISNVISLYSSMNVLSEKIIPNDHKNVYLKNLNIFSNNQLGAVCGAEVRFEVNIFSKEILNDIVIGIGIDDHVGTRILTPFSLQFDKKYTLNSGENIISCIIPEFPLKLGAYNLEVYIGTSEKPLDYYDKGFIMKVETFDTNYVKIIPEESQGSIILKQNWI
ncbi:Teichoic acids export ATP-binding protein TagH [Algoriella xinjiangensis]|uniref:ABC transporter ATP-binding protein n=1 Tax=Algoriella xinjiangensis TaxID=684065 RepID=UPI000F6316BB|nr:polysaccharide ABC transporter ATP-binding protein [Algoriella xinjiangensis]VDH17130.1 Teichoic acids export ATP-binding protein TagH [Algoriella xinjiangensis]